MGTAVGQKLVHKIFLKATPFPEELLVKNLATSDAKGAAATEESAPRQLFFVPGPGLQFSSAPHDMRADLAKIPAGKTIYEIRAVSSAHADFDYAKEYDAETAAAFLADSEHVADIVTTSEFVTSAFGDDGIFFRHEVRH
jgi:hypothetical protein